jgi:hypothetical protein
MANLEAFSDALTDWTAARMPSRSQKHPLLAVPMSECISYSKILVLI